MPRRDRGGLPRPPDGPVAGPGRGGRRVARRSAPPRGCHSRPRGCDTTSSGATGGLFHRASRRDPDGDAFAEVEAEVRYALGSGTRGITYLIERDGFLFQSPIAWFAQQRRWDISPGYGAVNPRPNFERAIQRECLFCHTNSVRSVAGTLNRYEPPIFEGHAIGCERCHGPGELHAGREGESAGTGPDDRQPGPPRPRAAGVGLSAMPPPGLVPLPQGGPRLLRLPPGPAAAPVPGCLRQEGRQSGQDGVDRPGRADGVEPLLPRQRRGARAASRATTRTACRRRRPRPPTIAAAASRATSGRAATLPAAERRARGPGRRLHRLPHAAPGRRGHPPHGDDRPPHPPRSRGTSRPKPGSRADGAGTAAGSSSRGTITGI